MVGAHGDGEAGDMNETTDTSGAGQEPPAPASGPSGQPGPNPYGPHSPGAPSPDPRAGQRSDWDEVRDVGRLRRPADRMVAGVAAGLARHLNIDPLVLRVAFVVLSFFGGAGVIVYGACWLLLPEDGAEHAPIHLDERSRSVALIGVLALASLALIGDSWGLYWFPWPLAVIAIVVWYFWNRSQRSHRSTSAEGQPYAPAPAGADPATYATAYAQQYAQPSTQPFAPAYAQPYAQPYAQSYAQSYAQPYAQSYGWTPPPAVQRPPLTRPRDPRRRGPILFWFTLALIALSLGVLGTVDLAGVSVADSAYPALAMTISGLMLLLGAFWGRAGGIVLIALVAGVTTLGAVAGENWQQHDLRFEPTTSSQVRDSYELEGGELTLDLTGVTDLEGLDGRTITIDGGAGRLEVRLPAGVDSDVSAQIGVGSIRLPGQGEVGGLGVSSESTPSVTTDAPDLTLRIDMGVGEVVVTRAPTGGELLDPESQNQRSVIPRGVDRR